MNAFTNFNDSGYEDDDFMPSCRPTLQHFDSNYKSNNPNYKNLQQPFNQSYHKENGENYGFKQYRPNIVKGLQDPLTANTLTLASNVANSPTSNQSNSSNNSNTSNQTNDTFCTQLSSSSSSSSSSSFSYTNNQLPMTNNYQQIQHQQVCILILNVVE